MKILDLVIQENKAYFVSGKGDNILGAGIPDFCQRIDEQTIALFRRAVLGSEYIRKNFLVLFTGDQNLDPFKAGKPVAITPIQGQKTYKLRSELWEKDIILTRLQTQGIIWGLKQWCQFLSLVDEIFIRPQSGVGEEEVNIMFPVDIENAREMSIMQFHVILEKYLPLGQPVYKDTMSISIPLLFYRLCPGEHIPLDIAKKLLTQWLDKNKEFAFIESSSFPVLQSGRFRRGTANIVWRKQEDAFLFQNGRYFSRLFASEALWGVK